MNSNNSNSKNPISPAINNQNPNTNPNTNTNTNINTDQTKISNFDEFNNGKKNKKNKRKKYINQHIKEEYDNYLESKNILDNKTNYHLSSCDNLTNVISNDILNELSSDLEITKLDLGLGQNQNQNSNPNLNKFINQTQSPKKNFYKNNSSKSLNNLKIKEMKNSIRKNPSYNIIGDIILEINSLGEQNIKTRTNLSNQIDTIRTSYSLENLSNTGLNTGLNTGTTNQNKQCMDKNILNDNRFAYLIGDEEIDINNDINNEIVPNTKKNNLFGFVDENDPKIILDTELNIDSNQNYNKNINNKNNSNSNIISNQNQNQNQNQNTNSNNKSNKKNKKQNLTNSNNNDNNNNNNISNIKFEDIKDLDLKINDSIDYNLINTPFKIIGEELLNEEINNKYKTKNKQSSENQQIIKKLKDVFKKLVSKELREKPNVSQILLDNEITDDVKIKILRKYIKFNTEDEVFSEEADKIKLEIKNLLKQKKIRKTDDYEELGLLVEKKYIPDNLKLKLEDIYYRVIGGDQPKLHNLLNNILKLPWEKKPNIFDEISKVDVSHETKTDFIKSLYKKLDNDLYGLEETKDSIMSWICQKIHNPTQKTNKYLCLCGPAGVGKTSIVHSISESLGIPYSYISLANIDEPGSLIGHGYTYEGSQYGSVAGGMIKNGCTNGILLFDELDKTKEKVQNTLLGIFDPLQNTKFRDAYFGEFYLNLSDSMMIICLNNLGQINPILKDRLHIVNIPGYTNKEKKIIINKYIIPKLELQYNINMTIEEAVINKILEINNEHKGIRQIQMYFIKIYELMILDKYTNKYNFNGIFEMKNLILLKIPEVEKYHLSMFS